MSSKQTKSGKKVRSIARRLARRNTVKNVTGSITASFFMCLLVIVTSLAVLELSANDGKFFKDVDRKFYINRDKTEELQGVVVESRTTAAERAKRVFFDPELLNGLVVYVIEDASGVICLEKKVGEYIIYPVTFFAMFMVIRLLFSIIGGAHERRRVQDILSPIEEIADRADELSRMEFDEEKYLILEEKIDSLASEDSLQVSKGDKELERIEGAINRLLTRMRESNMRQARFVNDASHELRTPIAVIEGYSNMLARWGKEDEKVLDESIAAIRTESAHMKYLVEQLLFLARGDSGKTVLHPEAGDLSEMMREIYEESLMIDENHIYRFTPAPVPVMRMYDPALLKQAVRILVDNAAKYTKEGDEIVLSLGEDSGAAYLQVQDTGIGMEQADVSHMFERFYRADSARTYKGTGLGLSIAKWIVDKHGGHFEVISRSGLGTRIKIVLEGLERCPVNIAENTEKTGIAQV